MGTMREIAKLQFGVLAKVVSGLLLLFVPGGNRLFPRKQAILPGGGDVPDRGYTFVVKVVNCWHLVMRFFFFVDIDDSQKDKN